LYNQRRSLVNVPKSGRPRKTARITDRKIGILSRPNPFWDAVKIKRKIPNVNLFLLKIEEPGKVCKRTFELDAAPMDKHPIL
jgi:hypothetical protein